MPWPAAVQDDKSFMEKYILVLCFGVFVFRTAADRPPTARTCPISDFWSNFARFGSQNCILTKFIDDSAWFLLEKLKKHVILIKTHNI